MELLQTALENLHSALCVAAPDSQLSLKSVPDGKIGRQGMGFGTGDKPIQMLFGTLKIANPEEDGNAPDQGDGQRQRMIHSCSVLNCLARALRRLRWMALQPQGPCQDGAG